jgi:hypothetical protein
VNVYNKWINLLECESIAKQVGMGTKSLFYCSPTMFEKHKQCMKNGMTRIEVSKKIYSAKEETDFFKSSNSIKWYSKVVDDFLHSINDPVIKLNH